MRFPVNGVDIQSDNYTLRCRPDLKPQQDHDESASGKTGSP
jgi:hypothetical protein